MNVPAFIPKTAWQPLTPRGVAAFASATTNRLMLVQFLCALAGAVAAGWLVNWAWIPPIRAAIAALPAESNITRGELQWPTNSPFLLADDRFLCVAVDLDHVGKTVTSSDLLLEFGRNDWRISSVLGALDLPSMMNTRYPPGYTVALNRNELAPWWGAREPFIIALVMGLTALLLMTSWVVLATVYAPLVWLGAFYANRMVTLGGCWRLAGAALLPGALFMFTAMVFYGLGAFDLLRLTLAFGMHVVVSWFYLVAGTICLPRHPAVPPPGANPFATEPPTATT